jgi:hypothetical protein
MTNLIRERVAVELMRDRGCRLAKMNTRHGVKWFLIPHGEVSTETASKIRSMPQVAPSRDGLFPGLDQTWRWA